MHELERWMLKLSIDILCIQETHTIGSAYLIHDDFLIILSGGEGQQRSYAGVGFIVSPRVRHAVSGFLQHSDRLASLRVRVPGGEACFVSVYAPTNEYSFEVRQSFYYEAQDFVSSQRVHGPTFALGDFKARLHLRTPADSGVAGDCAFGNPNKTLDPRANRELLLEMCRALDSVLANTLFVHDDEEIVTYRGWGVPPLDTISHEKFAQLDHVVAPCKWLHTVQDVYSDRSVALRSQHFILTLVLCLDIPAQPKRQHRPSPDLTTLLSEDAKRLYCDEFVAYVGDCHNSTCENELAIKISDAMHRAAAKLPTKTLSARWPWISEWTLQLIEQRNDARLAGDYAAEMRLSAAVKRSAKDDRKEWLESSLIKGDWDAVRRLRKGGKQEQHGRLRDADGHLVASDQRAETLALYLERVQWAVKFPDAVQKDDRMFDSDLPVDTSLFRAEELHKVVSRCKRQKASGCDDIPADFGRR